MITGLCLYTRGVCVCYISRVILPPRKICHFFPLQFYVVTGGIKITLVVTLCITSSETGIKVTINYTFRTGETLWK